MEKDSRIYIAGHRGLAGSAIVRGLRSQDFNNLITRPSSELDLRNQAAVEKFFQCEKPEFVIVAAARVGGILANSNEPGTFISDNLAIQSNLIDCARRFGVRRLIFLGSSCIFPRDCRQPIEESYLLTGPLEVTNQAYSIAKIAGIEMCRSFNLQFGTRFLALMPPNLYGPNDNYDLQRSHVMPAIIAKCHKAKTDGSKEVVLWGSGTPLREFLHSDDLAQACIHFLCADDSVFDLALTAGGPNSFPLINVGSGSDCSIADLADLIREKVGFKGTFKWDTSKPDGTPRKLLSSKVANSLGWHPRITLRDGIDLVYHDFQRTASALNR